VRVAVFVAVAALAGCGGGSGGGGGSETGPTVAGFQFTAASNVADGTPIAQHYTCDGESVPPELAWKGVPEGTKELALVVEDPDAPSGTFTHWLVYGIDPTQTTLASPDLPAQGKNDFGNVEWGGPCPPSGETHHYVFRLLALHARLELDPGLDRGAFDEAVAPHILAEARLTAPYERP
jgi:Raf kinase inhibitor-like YbhB/YbcL family protein